MIWILDIAKKAKERRIKNLLNGGAGNMTISYCGINRPSFLRQFYRKAKTRLAPEKELWQKFSALHPEFANDKKFIKKYKIHAPYQAFSPSAALLNMGDATKPVSILRAMLGINHVDPTFDEDLVDYCLALPNSQFYHSGQRRLLIRRAMKNLLPSTVLWRNERGVQGANWIEVFDISKKQFVNEIKRIENSAILQSLLDKQRLKNLISSWPQSHLSTTTREDLYRLLVCRGTCIGKFLLWLDEKDSNNFQSG